MPATEVVYGFPPSALVPPLEGALQLSPLTPGSFPLENLAPESLTSAVALAPPGTLERRYTLAALLRALGQDQPFSFLAPKDKGGSRLAKELKEFGLSFEEDSRQHHRICTGRKGNLSEAAETALLEGAPRLSKITGLWTQPGVFSWDRLDSGSQLLVEQLPALSGHGADLGAGLGFLTRRVLQSPRVKKMELVEIDRRAVSMLPKNVDTSRADIHWADLRSTPLSFGRLDFVVMNPPFHDAGQEDQSLGLAFLEKAAALLRKGGVAWIVANRHLPYEALLSSLFAQATLLQETAGFKIYKAEK